MFCTQPHLPDRKLFAVISEPNSVCPENTVSLSHHHAMTQLMNSLWRIKWENHLFQQKQQKDLNHQCLINSDTQRNSSKLWYYFIFNVHLKCISYKLLPAMCHLKMFVTHIWANKKTETLKLVYKTGYKFMLKTAAAPCQATVWALCRHYSVS